MPRDNRCVYMAHVCFYVCWSECVGVCENVCCVAAVVKVFFRLEVLTYVVYLCKGCGRCYVFCLYCDTWSCVCSCMGNMSVWSCRCCMFVSCEYPVAVLNAAFCMTCSLLMLLEDARGEHMEQFQTTQPTSGGAVTTVTNCCKNCVEPPRPNNGCLIFRFL